MMKKKGNTAEMFQWEKWCRWIKRWLDSSARAGVENVWDSEKRWYWDPGLSQNMKYACTGILTYFDCDRSLSSIIEQGKPRHCHNFFLPGARLLLCRAINLRTLNFQLCLNLFWGLHDSKVMRRIYGTFCLFGVHKILVVVINCQLC